MQLVKVKVVSEKDGQEYTNYWLTDDDGNRLVQVKPSFQNGYAVLRALAKELKEKENGK